MAPKMEFDGSKRPFSQIQRSGSKKLGHWGKETKCIGDLNGEIGQKPNLQKYWPKVINYT